MAGKTGGNKKVSSPSTIAYWLRAKNGKFMETHKARRIAKHAKRMGLTKAQIEAACTTPTFPEIKVPEALESVTFTGIVPEHRKVVVNEYGETIVLSLPKFIMSEGKILDVIRAH